MMKIYHLHREQYLPVTIDEAWNFFSAAQNLSKITPPEMGFVILTDLKDEPIYHGMKIDYTVKPLFGIPLHWTTAIGRVNAPYKFTDSQTKGPYSLWEHTHTFEKVQGGVKMTDDVKYALPLGILGQMAHSIIVRQKLEHIFKFREGILRKIFGTYKFA